ncbi:hypothetical protein L3Q82_000793 [Scortum barcoo]|uniref:Uncharacterized protein n=1 Tax=Scortum barcoo TaxID=214431 RepID=A0ACB8WDC1_9TELE|nr:hypothetical protein L3Q82_000793 [Scortum barcoo]
MPLDASLGRCSRRVPPGEGPWKTQDTLERLCLSAGLGTPGIPRKSWRKCLGCSAVLAVQCVSGRIWEFPITLIATEPQVDDVIFTEATELGKTSAVGFRLTSTTRRPEPFTATFLPGSSSDFTVTPASGMLPPVGATGALITVSFTPTSHKNNRARLIVQAADMQWTYEVRGKTSHDSPLLCTTSTSPPALCPANQRQHNFVARNLRLPALANSKLMITCGNELPFLPSSAGALPRQQMSQAKITALENVARLGTASQSSTYSTTGIASHAIDGNRNSEWLGESCTHTNEGANNWWSVLLPATYKITSVSITNRNVLGSRLNNAQLRIGNFLENNGNYNPSCAVIIIPDGATRTFDCRGMVGRLVSVNFMNTLTFLTLCEVEVYGASLNQIYCCSRPPELAVSSPSFSAVVMGRNIAVVEKKLCWSDALFYCRDFHWDLLSIRSEAEQREVEKDPVAPADPSEPLTSALETVEISGARRRRSSEAQRPSSAQRRRLQQQQQQQQQLHGAHT